VIGGREMVHDTGLLRRKFRGSTLPLLSLEHVLHRSEGEPPAPVAARAHEQPSMTSSSAIYPRRARPEAAGPGPRARSRVGLFCWR